MSYNPLSPESARGFAAAAGYSGISDNEMLRHHQVGTRDGYEAQDPQTAVQGPVPLHSYSKTGELHPPKGFMKESRVTSDDGAPMIAHALSGASAPPLDFGDRHPMDSTERHIWNDEMQGPVQVTERELLNSAQFGRDMAQTYSAYPVLQNEMSRNDGVIDY